MKNRRFHIVIASVVFAALTWLSVNMREEYTVVVQMPVVLEHLREGKALKHPIPRSITVRLRGTGWALAALYLTSDAKYVVDVATLSAENTVVTERDLLEHIKLPEYVQVLDVSPDSIVLALDEYREKRVAVVSHVSIGYREGYGPVSPMTVVPESIAVGGAQTAIEAITSWPTIYRKLENVRASIDTDIPLEDPPYYAIELSQQSVRVKVNVQPFAEKVFTGIPIAASGVPGKLDVIFIPARMDVIVRGGIEQLAKLENQDFRATVNFQSLLQDSTEYITPHLSAPQEVRVVRRKPDRVQFVVRKRP